MISEKEIILRLVVALVLGCLVGVDRQRLDRAAGLRTHALVCLGSALIMIVSAYGFSGVLGPDNVRLDPSRIAAQVVSGIGFLGAGTIIMRREIVRGLTTAASVWAVAGIGLAVGGGLYLAAVTATILTLVILAAIKPLERRLFVRTRARVLVLRVDRSSVPLRRIDSQVKQDGLRLERMLILPGDAPEHDRVELVLSGAKHERLLSLMDNLRQMPGVNEINAESRSR